MGDGLRAHDVPVCVCREPAKARCRAVGGPDAGLHGMRLLVRSPRAPRVSVRAAAPKNPVAATRLRGRRPPRRYRASTDLCGLRSFYAVWLLAYASQCASCVSWCLWCDAELAWHSTRVPMLVCCGLTTLVGLVIAGGCVACALAVAAPGSASCDGSGPPACDTLVMHAEGLFYLCWGWAWAIVATRVYLLLRDRQRDSPRSDAAVVHFFWFDLAVHRATRFRLLHVANVLAPAALCT